MDKDYYAGRQEQGCAATLLAGIWIARLPASGMRRLRNRSIF